ncbi:MAG: hypothetical protein HYU99_09570 [Deltaproteobacteria bacterium]|nr:hypothetical protein [Deltaproteobacteria bacterium]
MIDVAKHPEKDRALLFLDTMLHSGLQSEREFRDPAQTKVAIVGFGDETATIKVFLDAGYQVIAVENFSYLKAANGPKKTEIEERFSDHPHLDRLTIIDVAEGTTLPEADLVIASALIDEAFETSARLVKRGGIIAVTEMGQVGSKRINYIVDAPDSYIREAQGIPRTFEEVLYFNTVHGPSILPSGFFHMFGHSAYILRRTE